MKTIHMKTAAVSTLILGFGSILAAQNVYDSNPLIRQQQHRPADPWSDDSNQSKASEQPGSRFQGFHESAHDPRGRTASDLVGMNVYSPNGEKLGEIKDLAVDPQSGKIVYSLISARSFGDSYRAVPFAALKQDASNPRQITLDIDQSKWMQAPSFQKSQIASLGQDQRGKDVFQYYGQTPQQSQRLLLTSEVIGSKIRSGDQNVGKVEDVVVQIPSGSAAALLDPNDDFVGSDQKYLIPLSRLTQSGKDMLTTNLSRQDFSSARTASDDSWSRSQGGENALYIWPAYSDIQQGRSGQGVAQSTSAPVDSVRRAIDSDPSSAEGQGVSVAASGDKLILSGTVRSSEVKDRLQDRAEQAAKGWSVDNQIRVVQEGEAE